MQPFLAQAANRLLNARASQDDPVWPLASAIAFFAAIPDRLAYAQARMRWVMDRQRQRRALLDLNDHRLNDIGISRRQALKEGRKPFWK